MSQPNAIRESLHALSAALIKSAIGDIIESNNKNSNQNLYEAERWIFGDGKGLLTITWAADAAHVNIEFIRNMTERAIGNPKELSAHTINVND